MVAPAGNEGAAAPGSGTVGSPASARDSLAVGALAGLEPQPRTALTLDGEKLADAAALAGDPPPDGQTAGPVTGTDTAALGKQLTSLRDKVVIVKAGANPPAQAAAAAAVGARAVVIAAPGEAAAAGPVRRALGGPGDRRDRRARHPRCSRPSPERRSRSATRSARRAPTPRPPRASRPTARRDPPPAACPSRISRRDASALSAGNGGKAVVIGGSAVAAARVAVIAAELVQRRSDLSPAQLRATLIAAGRPQDLPPDRTGAGAASDAFGTITANPPTAVSGALFPVEVNLTTTASGSFTFQVPQGASAQPPSASLVPGTPTTVNVRLERPGTVFGRLEVRQGNATKASVPWLVRPDTVKPVAVGALKVAGGRRVRFTLGSFKRGEQTQVQVAERLILDLVDARGNVRRSLTVKGGARDLMPAEYAYAIPRASLPDGGYAFRVRAWAPRQKEPTVRRSALLHQ